MTKIEAAVKLEAALIETSYINAQAFNSMSDMNFGPSRARIKPFIAEYKVQGHGGQNRILRPNKRSLIIIREPSKSISVLRNRFSVLTNL